MISRFKQIGIDWFALTQLTKRELSRKYARSMLGILWSIIYPLMRMTLVVFLFSYIFSKGIPKYPAYYFAGFLTWEFLSTASQTSLTTLKDNKDLMIKSKIPRYLLVQSRVMTAAVNYILGCIPFVGVLVWTRAVISWNILWIPIILSLLVLYVSGVSYLLSILYIFNPDLKNIYSNLLFVLRFFIGLFYSVDGVAGSAHTFIIYNPIYSYIKSIRECLIYGNSIEPFYMHLMIIYAICFFIVGRVVFLLFENRVVERL